METIYNILKSLNEMKKLSLEACFISMDIAWHCLYLSLQMLFLSAIMLFICCILLKLTVYFVPCGDRRKLHVAFFHPYCNAGGGGERVLWAAIRAIQERYPLAECYVYTGDCDVSPEQILANVEQKFGVILQRPPNFIYLRLRKLVEAKYYPYFTLLMQSFGSVMLAGEALGKFRPDIYIDSMGYAFTYPVFRYVGGCSIGSYTHYPTISSDMLGRVSDRTEAHNNRAFIANSSFLSFLKLSYYNIFAFVYGLVGRCSHVVMVNSSWTRGHIEALWKCNDRIYTVYPPCDTLKFSSLPLIPDEEKELKTLVSIGQFRPEKDYPLQLKAFCCLLQQLEKDSKELTKLILIGGVRNEEDESRVQSLKLLAAELGIADKVVWRINASFSDLIKEVQNGTIGLHTMWNEHFGIGVVECMAGGLLIIAHDSGGPKLDIVKPFEGQCTGFLASDEKSFADKMKEVLELSSEQKSKIRKAARKSVTAFSDIVFTDNFLSAMQSLLDPGRRD